MILVIDNYDSFTYNLVQYLGELGADLEVVRNDQTTVEAIAKQTPERIVISPGPKTPSDAGVCLEAIQEFKRRHGIDTVVSFIAEDFDDPLPEDFLLRPLPPDA